MKQAYITVMTNVQRMFYPHRCRREPR